MMRELTRESLLAETAKRIDAAFARGPGAASVMENRGQELGDRLAVKALLRLAPCVQALHARCLATGAGTEERAVRLAADSVMFAVPLEDPAVVGLAVQRGDDRFVTFVRRGPDGQPEKVDAVAWKPHLFEALTRLPDPLPTDPHALVRLAGTLAPYAQGGSDFDIEEIVTRVENNGNLPRDAVVAWLEITNHPADDDLEAFTTADGRCETATFYRYAEAMAPALAHAPATEGGPRIHFLSTQDRTADDVLKVDGGWIGPTARAVVDEYAARTFLHTARAQAPVMAQSHDAMVELGYVWGEKRLTYGDTDKRCFAIPTADLRVSAFVHENIDLCTPCNRFLVVLHRDTEGVVRRVEGHAIAQPAAASLGEADMADVEDLIQLSESLSYYEDPEATPPRLVLAEFARRLQAGEPLPPPAVGADLASGQVLAATAADVSGLRGYFHNIADNDSWVLNRLKAGEDGGIGCEDSAEFGDEELDGHDEDPSGPRR